MINVNPIKVVENLATSFSNTIVDNHNRFVDWTAKNAFKKIEFFKVSSQEAVNADSTLTKVAKVFFGFLTCLASLVISLPRSYSTAAESGVVTPPNNPEGGETPAVSE